ncbi:hypothetical protein ACFLQK_00070 [bacterium]
MKRSLLIRIVTIFFTMAVIAAGTLYAQEKVELKDARIYDENSLITSFLLVCDGESVKYSLVGGSPAGLDYLEITVQDKIINHRECRDSADCSMSGEVILTALPSQVVTAIVQDSKGLGHSEKLKITPVKNGTRVYYIGSVPGIGGQGPVILATSEKKSGNDTGSPVTVAGAGDSPGEGTGEKENEVTVQTPGPDINVDVSRNGDNDYTIQISANDPLGVDFVEILENGSFLDVEICDKKIECVMKKRLKGKKPGRNKYLLKSMNAAGAISFQEQLLYFTE